jgi:hypothetical protein
MSRSKLPWKKSLHGVQGRYCLEPISQDHPNVCNNISAEDADFILTAIRERDEYKTKYNKLKFIIDLQNETSNFEKQS